MNILDRVGVYREFHRVLKPGGRLAFFDPALAAPDAAPHYPTPWSADGAASHLLDPLQTRQALSQAGFADIWIEDVTASVLDSLTRAPPPPPAPAQLGLVLGDRFGPAVRTFVANLREARLRLLMGGGRRPD